jgi:hypothetical protein
LERAENRVGAKKLRQMEQSMDFHLVGETTWAMLGHEKLMKRLNLFVDYKVKVDWKVVLEFDEVY